MTLTTSPGVLVLEFQAEMEAPFFGGSMCEGLDIPVFEMISRIHSCALAFVFPGGLMDVAESCAVTARIPCD